MSDILKPNFQVQLDALTDADELEQGDDALLEAAILAADPLADPLAENTFALFHQQFVAGTSAARPDRSGESSLLSTVLIGAGGIAVVLVAGYLSQDATQPVASAPLPAAPQQSARPEATPSTTARPAPEAAGVERTPNRRAQSAPAPTATMWQTDRLSQSTVDEALASLDAIPASAPVAQLPQVSPPPSQPARSVSQSDAIDRPSAQTTPAQSSSSNPAYQQAGTPVQSVPPPTYIQANIAPPETPPAIAQRPQTEMVQPDMTAPEAPSSVELPTVESDSIDQAPIEAQMATGELEFDQSIAFRSYGVSAPEVAPSAVIESGEPSNLLIASIERAKTDGEGIQSLLNSPKSSQTSILPLSNRAAIEIAQADQVDRFRVLRLSQSDYQRVWLAAQPASSSQSVPVSGFIDYQRQIIILPTAAAS